MSDRARTAMIFGVVGLVVGGGFYYYKRVHQPKQALGDARDEVREWDARWTAARDCLLGPTPQSAKTSEALAIRELTAEKLDRGGCTKRISNISRKDGPDTGVDDVEGAWSAIDSATSKLAREFATHVASNGDNAEKLGEALARLDAAHDRLFQAVELDPPARTGKALPAATAIPIRDGKTPIDDLRTTMLPSAGGVTYYARADKHELEVHLAPNAAPQVTRVKLGMMRAVPDASWGAIAEDAAVLVGAADAEGAIASPTKLDITPAPALASVVGTPQSGVVVYGNSEKLAIARLAPPPAKPTVEVTPITLAMADRDFDGRVLVVWRDAKDKLHAKLIKPGQPDQELQVAAVPAGTDMDALCLTRDKGWLSTAAGMIGLGGAAVDGAVTTQLLGCTADAAVGHTGPRVYAVCAHDGCREQQATGAPVQSAVTVHGGKLVAASIRSGVLGVWRDGTPRFFAVPSGAELVTGQNTPAMILTDGKVLDILAKTDDDYLVLRVPLG